MNYIHQNLEMIAEYNNLSFESDIEILNRITEKETFDEAFNYTRNMDLTDYSKNKIEQHFKFIAFSKNAKDYRDNITLPLFTGVIHIVKNIDHNILGLYTKNNIILATSHSNNVVNDWVLKID